MPNDDRVNSIREEIAALRQLLQDQHTRLLDAQQCIQDLLLKLEDQRRRLYPTDRPGEPRL
jgi:hypothetical protein